MKKKITKIWSVGLVLVLLVTLLAFATPASSQGNPCEYAVVPTPGPPPLQIATGTDLGPLAIASDGTMFVVGQAPEAATATVTTVFTEPAVAPDGFPENFTVTYVDQDGNPANAGTLAIPSLAAVGTTVAIGLVPPDTGIRDITAIAPVGVNDSTGGAFSIAGNTSGTNLASFTVTAAAGVGTFTDGRPLTFVYKSTSGGLKWTASGSTNLMSSAVVALAVSPDYVNDSTVFIVDAGPPAQAYISTTGGASFAVLGGALPVALEVGTSLAVSPLYSTGTGEIMIGTQHGTGALFGDVYIWGRQGVQNWVAQALGEDVTSVAFSPNYPIDATILAVGSTTVVLGGTTMHTKVSTLAWDSISAGAPTTVDAAITEVGVVPGTDIVRSSIAIPSDFNGSIPPLQRAYVGTVSGLGDNVYRLTGTGVGVTPFALSPAGAAADNEYTSIVYSGDYNTGNLVVGNDANAAGAGTASQVRRCANPSSVNPLWYAATGKPPTGTSVLAAGPLTYLALDPEFADNNKVYAATVGTESAISVSNDGAANFDQTGLIDTVIAAIQGIAMVNANTWFMVTTDGAGSVESLWKKAGPPPDWVRVATLPTTANVMVRVSPDYATDSTLYFAAVGGTAIRMSSDGGVSFAPRIAAGAITDLMPTDGFTLYLATGANVRKSGNGGWTWGPPRATKIAAVQMLTYDATTGDIMAGGNAGNVNLSKDGGVNWEPVGGPGIAGGGNMVVAFDTFYSDNNMVYAADTTVAGIGGIWRNAVGPGSIWQTIDGGLMPGGACRGIALDSNGVMYAADSTPVVAAPAAAGGVLRSLDPRAPIGLPVQNTFERSANDDLLGVGVPLAGMSIAEGSTKLAVYKNAPGPAQVLDFNDTFGVAGPELVGPEEGAIAQVTAGAAAVNVVWSPVAGAKSYRVQMGLYEDFPPGTTVDNVVNRPVTNQIYVPALEGRTYYWRVRVETPVFSPYSEGRSVVTQIASAVNAPAVNVGPARGGTAPGGYDAPLTPTFSWSAFKWATGYHFQLAKDAAFTNVIADETLGNVSSYQYTKALDNSTTYYWRVKALGTATDSDWSAVAGFTTLDKPGPAAPPPVVVKEVPAPIINIPPAPPAQEIVIPPPPAPPAPISPTYIWVIIAIGAILAIAVIVLIVRTRRAV